MGGVVELESGGTGINDSDPLMNDVWVQHKSPLGWDANIIKDFLDKI